VPVTAEIGGQELERDLPAQARVLGLIDGAHAPAPWQIQDAVMGDSSADHDTLRGNTPRADGRDRRGGGPIIALAGGRTRAAAAALPLWLRAA
jgi:hypothetical protein